MNEQTIRHHAIKLAQRDGLANLSREAVCEAANVPPGSFAHVMGCSFSEFVEELRKDGHGDTVAAAPNRRIDPKVRRDQLLNIALQQAETDGYANLQIRTIAEAAGVSAPLVSRYFSTLPQLKRAVMRAAIHRGNFRVLAQGLACFDQTALKADDDLKEKAAQFVAGV